MIAEAALKHLGLDQVWLLVSPGNPLKSRQPPLETRLRSARAIGRPPAIIATTIEAELGTRFSFDTVRALQHRFPHVSFVFLIGADNLAQLPRWRRWRDLARLVPIAVYPRPGFTAAALHGQAAQALRHTRLPARCVGHLATSRPPAWLLLPLREDNISSTALRRHFSW